MRIAAQVVRVKNEFNLSTVGDIRIIDGMKIYNKGLCLHLVGDKPDTWHSGNDFRLTEDVDMPCLQKHIEHIAEGVRQMVAKQKESKKRSQNEEEEDVNEF